MFVLCATEAQACLWPIRNRFEGDIASQRAMGPCRDNLLRKWERVPSKTSDYFLLRDAGGPKDPGRCAFGPK